MLGMRKTEINKVPCIFGNSYLEFSLVFLDGVSD